jgi:ribonuclease J
MRFRIHRGAREIGGNCVEIESGGCSILIDLGLPLGAADPEPQHLPDVAGLTGGSNPQLLGIVLSHTHGDHCGLTEFVHPSVPVFMGTRAYAVQLASRPFLRRVALPPTVATYFDRLPFALGPFRITPLLADHSAFDAYSLLIEADGKRLFYSGDLRGHGRKARLFEALIARPPRPVDVLMLEGTTLSRPEAGDRAETEAELERRIETLIADAPGLVLAAFSPQNIDRFVTVFRATRRARRTFIADLYLAHVLDRLGLPSLPQPAHGAMRVYVPHRQMHGLLAQKRLDLLSRYGAHRIHRGEIKASPRRWVMLFRASMRTDVAPLSPDIPTLLLHAMWPGYLERDDDSGGGRGGGGLAAWCRARGIALTTAHTSGHADRASLIRFAQALDARMVVPIHTTAPDVMASLMRNVRPLADGEWRDA